MLIFLCRSGRIAAQALQVEVGRAIRGARGLARPYTPYVEPEVLVATGVRSQCTAVVFRSVLIRTTY